jgi:DNA replication protein DnaC
MKNCLMCGELLEGKREDSKFCSDSCKAKHWKKNHNGELKGIDELRFNPQINVHQNIPTTAKTEIKKIEPELEPFKNLVGEIKIEQKDTVKQIEPLSLKELPLPAQYINKIFQVPNFNFSILEKQLTFCQKDIFIVETEIKRLTNFIEQEKGRNGSGIYIAGASSGALLAYNLKPEAKKKDADNGILYTFLGGLLGLGVGRIIDEVASDGREKSKRENIAKYEKQKAEYQNKLQILKTKEKQIILEKSKYPPFEQKEIKILNSAYSLILKHNEEQKLKIKNSSAELNSVKQTEPKNTSEPKEFESDKITSMKNLAQMKFSLLDFEGKWKDFFGQPQTNFFCVIHGMSGEGKSHFAMQFAKYLAERFGNVLYVSGEEGFAPTFQKKVQSLGANIKNLYAGDIRTGKELLTEAPHNKFHFIVIDSLNNMGIDPEMMRNIRKKFKDSSIIAICQNTKDGKVRGSYEIMHDSDMIVKVSDGIAITIKNRFKEKNMQFDVFEVLRKKESKIIPINRKKENEGSGMDTDLRNTI